MADFICVYFGSPDECQLCGGSVTLGGTQAGILVHGTRLCSLTCAYELSRFPHSTRVSDCCPTCGFDRHEHAEDCAA